MKSAYGSAVPPFTTPAATEELLTGGRLLRRAFLEMPARLAGRGEVIVRLGEPNPPLFQLRRGMVFSCSMLPEGRRAITDLLLPFDIGCLEQTVSHHAHQDIIAASACTYRKLSSAAFRELMRNGAVALTVMSLVAEARRRMDRHVAALARLDARERIGGLLLDIYDRLRRQEMINQPCFNLDLTQEQIGDYLGLTVVHVNRILRQLREEGLASFNRHVIIIMDVERLRELVAGLPPLGNSIASADQGASGRLSGMLGVSAG
ncbi:MAG: Crp/Fnr family transcriptional regulator [Alphaproteobacteria bacterium]|nr:Crp/Fnr family transcriptional regulator [Alphaproteobacteria bacterium]